MGARTILALALLALPAFAKELNAIDFHIKPGKHGASNDFPGVHALKVGKTQDRTLRFQVLFPQDAAYQASNPGRQADCNKVMGITLPDIHKTSVRLCWSFNPATRRMRVGLYGYLRGAHANEVLTEVPLDTWTDVSLRLWNGGMSATAGGHTTERRQDLGFVGLTTTAILKTAYFGGEDTAPHDVHVRVRNIEVH